MILYSNFTISKKHNGEIWTNAPDGRDRMLNGTVMEREANRVIHILRTRYTTTATKEKYAKAFINELATNLGVSVKVEGSETPRAINSNVVVETEEDRASKTEALRISIAQRLMDFFSEFDFEVSERFLNSLAHADDKKEYVLDYLELSGNPYTYSVKEKMRSMEFGEIMRDLNTLAVETHVNKRFKLYYGSAGTGKTTTALKEADGNCTVCHNGIQPENLMEDFDFESGKPTFRHGILRRSMEEGKKIVFDEINLLPTDSLRFLQTVLDNKTEFDYKGQTVHIADGFQIIGTMNLVVNGTTYPLFDPLVDRAEEFKKFKLTAKDLARALI